MKFGDIPMRTSGSWAKSNDRVLVIADSDEMRKHLATLLGQEGFVVFEQPSAIGATRSIRENAIRAVVVDVTVPGMRSEKLVSVMRENPRLEGLIIVAITDGVDPGIDTEGLARVDAAIERSSAESRLAPLLARLLRTSSFRPQVAFSMSAGKS